MHEKRPSAAAPKGRAGNYHRRCDQHPSPTQLGWTKALQVATQALQLRLQRGLQPPAARASSRTQGLTSGQQHKAQPRPRTTRPALHHDIYVESGIGGAQARRRSACTVVHPAHRSGLCRTRRPAADLQRTRAGAPILGSLAGGAPPPPPAARAGMADEPFAAHKDLNVQIHPANYCLKTA